MRRQNSEFVVGRRVRSLLLVGTVLVCCRWTWAQSAAATKPVATEHSESQAAPSPLILKDLVPASTDKVAASAAKDLARKEHSQSKASTQDGGVKAAPGNTPSVANGAVVEFQPAAAGAGSDRRSETVISKGERQPGSRIHGDLYGATGAGGHATSEAVGVTSKNKKTSAYVQGDQTNLNSPQGH